MSERLSVDPFPRRFPHDGFNKTIDHIGTAGNFRKSPDSETRPLHSSAVLLAGRIMLLRRAFLFLVPSQGWSRH